MTELTESRARHETPGPEDSVAKAPIPGVSDEGLEMLQDVDLALREALEALDSREEPEQGNGQTACLPAGDSPGAELKWAVGAQCRAVWSKDGQEYPATVVSVDGGRCRVSFNGYGNEEDMELGALKSPDAALQTQNSQAQKWKPGSRCRAVYSEDGLVYPAVVLWVKGQRCRIRFDNYNNEEEQDVKCLLNSYELNGPSRAATVKVSNSKSSTTNSRRRREENQGERGRERPAWRADQNSCRTKEGPGNQSKVEKEADEMKGRQQTDRTEKPTGHSLPRFPPFPPPPQFDSDPLSSFTPAPPPPLWMFGSKEDDGSPRIDAMSHMLMLWYMCGFYTGSFMAQQMYKSASKD